MEFDSGSESEGWSSDGGPVGGGTADEATGAARSGPDAEIPATDPDAGADGFAAQPPPVVVPDELDGLPPGALLAEILDDVPVDSVSGYDTVVVLAAAYRQLCRQQAVFYEALVETGLRAEGSAEAVARLTEPGGFAVEEARAKLVWSWQRSCREYQLGFALFVRFPRLGEALGAGQIDLPRARAFVDWTDGLTDSQAGAIIDQLLPEAAMLVVGALIDQIKRAAIAVDPEWAARRYAAAVKTRRVRGFANADGTANLGGYAQPADRVVAACHRIDTLARACKAAGDRRRLDLIRSDLYLRMLDGSFETMTDAEIVAHVRAQPLDDLTGVPDPTSDSTDSDPDGSDDDGDDGDDDSGGGTCGTGSGGDIGDGPAHVTGQAPPRQQPAGPDHRRGASAPGVGQQVPELRAQLATLLGDNDAPAHVPGWHYLPAELGRALARTMGSAEWRWVVCDSAGHAIDAGLTSARPTDSSPARRDPRRGGIVEIAVTTTHLRALAVHPDLAGAWAPVVTDINRQHRAASTGGAGPGGSPPSRPEADRHDTGRRHPPARLRRWIEIRDRSCLHPCCRARATSSQIDHRIPWAVGGPTGEHNLGPLCGHDHRVKDVGGWQLHQPAPGVHVWTSPLGHAITRRLPPVIPPAAPRIDRDDGLPAEAGGGNQHHWCSCLLRPCLHDHSSDGSGDDGRSETPHLDELRQQAHARESFYEDEPPF